MADMAHVLVRKDEALGSRFATIENLEPLATASGLGPDDELVDFKALLNMIWRRKVIIAGMTAICTTIAALILFQLTPIYTATAVIMLDPRERSVVDIDAVVGGLPSDAQAVQSEIQRITSTKLIGRAVDDLRLLANPEFNDALRDPHPAKKLLDLSQLVPTAWLSTVGAEDELVEDVAEEAAHTRAKVVSRVLDSITVKQKGLSRAIEISFKSAEPATAAAVANKIADLYIVSQLDERFEATERASQWLGERLEELREKALVSDRAVEEYRAASGLFEGKDSSLAAEQISELNTQLVLANSAKAEAEAEVRQLESITNTGGLPAAAEILDSRLIQDLRSEQALLTRRVADMAQEYGPRHPKMLSVAAEIDDLNAQIGNEIRKELQRRRTNLDVAAARERYLRGEVARLNTQAAALKGSEVKLRALEREAEANRALFARFLTRFKEIGSQEGFDRAEGQIITEATESLEPSFPKVKLLLSLAFVGAGVLGVGLAFLVETLDSGFRNGEQIEAQLGVGNLGLVPSLSRFGRISPQDYSLDKPASAFAESIRTLHTNLMLSALDQEPKTIMLTSSVAGEGKSTVAVCLARALAAVSKNVVIVDCDLRRPMVHMLLSSTRKPGLVDYLIEDAGPEVVLQRDAKSGTHFITAGMPTVNPPNLLRSEKFANLLRQLRKSFDYVVVDTPPVMAVSDAQILAKRADKIVFLVRWAETRRETARLATKRLQDAGGDIAGVLLSRVDVRRLAAYRSGEAGVYYKSKYGKNYYTS